jgi:hypothetical protein
MIGSLYLLTIVIEAADNTPKGPSRQDPVADWSEVLNMEFLVVLCWYAIEEVTRTRLLES